VCAWQLSLHHGPTVSVRMRLDFLTLNLEISFTPLEIITEKRLWQLVTTDRKQMEYWIDQLTSRLKEPTDINVLIMQAEDLIDTTTVIHGTGRQRGSGVYLQHLYFFSYLFLFSTTKT